MSLICAIATFPRHDAMKWNGIEESQCLKNFNSRSFSSSSMSLSISAREGPEPGVIAVRRKYFINPHISYLMEQNSISVIPVCSDGGSFILTQRSESFTFSGFLVSQDEWRSTSPAPASLAEILSRITICHHSRRRISASKIENCRHTLSR